MWIILTIYFGTALFSYPFLVRLYRISYEDWPGFHYKLLAFVVTIIPLFNLYRSIPSFFGWLLLYLINRKLKRVFKNHADPNIREKVKEAVKNITEVNKPDL